MHNKKNCILAQETDQSLFLLKYNLLVMIKIHNHIENKIYDDFISEFENLINQNIVEKSETTINIISSKMIDSFCELKQTLKTDYGSSPYCFCYNIPNCEIKHVIIVNEELCKTMNFSRSDHYAALLHEIGHFWAIQEYGKNILDNNISLSEYLSDKFVLKLGMGKELISVLQKMSASGFYTPDYCKNAIDWRIDRLTDKLSL